VRQHHQAFELDGDRARTVCAFARAKPRIDLGDQARDLARAQLIGFGGQLPGERHVAAHRPHLDPEVGNLRRRQLGHPGIDQRLQPGFRRHAGNVGGAAKKRGVTFDQSR